MLARTTFRIALGLTLCTAVTPGVSALQTIEDITCDGGACPRPLELVNETPVTIGLSGQGLAGLTSGVVTDRSGRPIEGVSVVLGEVPRTVTRSLTTTRPVTLTARGLGALTGLQLRFTTSRQGTVTAPLELSVTRGAGDLFVSDCGFEIDGQNVIAWVEVTNAGPGDANFPPRSVVARVIASPWSQVDHRASASGLSIPAHGATVLRRASGELDDDSASYALVWVLDPAGVVTETNRANNRSDPCTLELPSDAGMLRRRPAVGDLSSAGNLRFAGTGPGKERRR